MTPNERLAQYRKALRQLYGTERAIKSELYYERGWYYVNLAQRFPDGSVGIMGRAQGHRAKQIEEMTATLLSRVAAEKESN